MAQTAIDAWTRRTQSSPRSSSSALAPWTRRIVAGEASLTDVPAHDRGRIAREVKAYADHFPDVGRSPTVRRLIDDLNEVDVGE